MLHILSGLPPIQWARTDLYTPVKPIVNYLEFGKLVVNLLVASKSDVVGVFAPQ